MEENKFKLFDIFLKGKQVPDQVRKELFVEKGMDELWEDCSGQPFNPGDLSGMERLEKSIVRRTIAARTARLTAAAMVVSVFFAAGYFISGVISPKAAEIVLTTSENSGGVYTLPDGSRVHLNAGSTLRYEDGFKNGKRAVALMGECFFDVTKKNGIPFYVTMENSTIKVLGTSFNARCYPDSGVEEVVLKTGSVELNVSGQENAIVMKPGDRIRYALFDGNIIMDKVDINNRCRWYEENMNFENAAFNDILSNLESRYRIKIVNRSGISSETRLSLTVGKESPEEMMDVLCKLLHMKYVKTETEIILAKL